MKRAALITMAFIAVGVFADVAKVATVGNNGVATSISKFKTNEEIHAFAKRQLEAVGAKPVSPEEKTVELTTLSRQLLRGVKSLSVSAVSAVISEIYNTIPYEQLVAVSAQLQQFNLNQKINSKLSDADYDALAAEITGTGADYIQNSGTDSPNARIAIMCACFIQGSTDSARTQSAIVAKLPAGAVASVISLVAAAQNNKTDTIAMAGGTDEMVPASETNVEKDEEEEPIAPIPLLARDARSASGLTGDTIDGVTSNVAMGTDSSTENATFVPTEIGFDTVIQNPISTPINVHIHGPIQIIEPSPIYGGQSI